MNRRHKVIGTLGLIIICAIIVTVVPNPGVRIIGTIVALATIVSL